MKLIITIDDVAPNDLRRFPCMGTRVVVASDNHVMALGTVDGYKLNGQTSKPLRSIAAEVQA